MSFCLVGPGEISEPRDFESDEEEFLTVRGKFMFVLGSVCHLLMMETYNLLVELFYTRFSTLC